MSNHGNRKRGIFWIEEYDSNRYDHIEEYLKADAPQDKTGRSTDKIDQPISAGVAQSSVSGRTSCKCRGLAGLTGSK